MLAQFVASLLVVVTAVSGTSLFSMSTVEARRGSRVAQRRDRADVDIATCQLTSNAVLREDAPTASRLIQVAEPNSRLTASVRGAVAVAMAPSPTRRPTTARHDRASRFRARSVILRT